MFSTRAATGGGHPVGKCACLKSSSLPGLPFSRFCPVLNPPLPFQGTARSPSSASGATTPDPQPLRAVPPHPTTAWEASLLRHEPLSPLRFSRSSTPTLSLPSSPGRPGLSAPTPSQRAPSVADTKHGRDEGSSAGTFADREAHWQEQLVRAGEPRSPTGRRRHQRPALSSRLTT